MRMEETAVTKRLMALLIVLAYIVFTGIFASKGRCAGTAGTPAGTEFHFDGRVHIECSTLDRLGITDAFTLEAWLKPLGEHDYNVIVSALGKEDGFALFLYRSTRVKFGINNCDNKNAIWSSAGIVEKQYNHIVAVYDKGAATIYINGVSRGRKTFTDTAIIKNKNRLVIGKGPGSSLLKGDMAALRIYDRAIDSNEVAWNFDNRRNGKRAINNRDGLVLDLDFGGMTKEGLYKDTSGKGNDGRVMHSSAKVPAAPTISPQRAEDSNSTKMSLPVVPLKAQVKSSHGVPMLFLNDKPTSIRIYREHNYKGKEEYIKNLAASGVNVFFWGVSSGAFHPAQKNYGSLPEFFEKEYWGGKFNAPVLREIIKTFPDAKFIIQLDTTARVQKTKDWFAQHPDHIAVWPPNMAKGNRGSIASEIWREETIECLKAQVGYLRESPFADRIIGYIICGGGGEWGDYWDYSPVAQKAFARYITNKYNNDIGLLRDAWNDNTLDFKNISMPGFEELFTADDGIFYNPVKSRKVADFFEQYYELAAEVISDFAKAMKEASNNESLVGTWVGANYYPGWHDQPYAGLVASRRRGAFERLIYDKNIDFFFTPFNYRERHAGGVFQPQYLLPSAILHGKMAIVEDDSRTCASTLGHPSYVIAESIGDNFGWAKTPEETISVLKRNFAGIHTRVGSSICWFSMGSPGGKSFDHPEIFKAIKNFSAIADRLLENDRNNAQIAVIYNNKSFNYQKFSFACEDFIFRQSVEGISRLGAPFDDYLDTDLTSPDFPFDRYKLYIFANTFYLSDKVREIIDQRIKRNGNVLLWIYAPGYITDNGLSVKAMSDTIGMEMKHLDLPGGATDYTSSKQNNILDAKAVELQKGLDVYLIDYAHRMTKGLATDLRYGLRQSLSPVFSCIDKQAIVLGEGASTSSTVWTFRQAGLCVKEFKDWTSVWSAVPNIPSSLLRNIAGYAGVHIYDKGDDQVFASERLLAIHTRYAGERIIKLPKKCDIYDPFKKDYIAKKVQEFKVDLPAASTGLWMLE